MPDAGTSLQADVALPGFSDQDPPVYWLCNVIDWFFIGKRNAQNNCAADDKMRHTEMINMNLTAIALQGIESAGEQVNASARKIAAAGSGSSDIVDLSTAAVEMMQAKNGYEANVNVMKTAQEMDKHLLDVLG